MALTRAALKEMGVTEKEVIDAIMESHGASIETAKEKATATAELKAQKTIDELQAKVDNLPEPPSDGGNWKEKYETLVASSVDKDGKTYKELHDAIKGEFDTYKTNIETKELTAAQNKALHEALKAAGANEKFISLVVDKVDRTKAVFDGDIENGFTVKNSEDIVKPVKEQYGDIFGTVQTVGANVATPPKSESAPKDLFVAGFDGK